MKAEIIYLTPKKAKELLKGNIANRKLKKGYKAMVNAMKSGQWMENGEAIIVDINGIVKDGQHRLYAAVEANYSFHVPLITGVDADIMHTIDTGTNRTLSDVLELNGFKDYAKLSALLKRVHNINQGRSVFNDGSGKNSGAKIPFSNTIGLEIARRDGDKYLKIVKVSTSIYNRQSVRIFNSTEIGAILYLLAGLEFSHIHIDFLRKLTGVDPDASSATFYVYNKLLKAKNSNVKISNEWVISAILRVWEIFQNGDVPVKYLKINTKQ